jgi:hypothetical protein
MKNLATAVMAVVAANRQPRQMVAQLRLPTELHQRQTALGLDLN